MTATPEASRHLNAFEAARFVRLLAEQQCDLAFIAHVRRDTAEAWNYVIKPPGNVRRDAGNPRNYVVRPPETEAIARIIETQYEFHDGHRIPAWRLVLHPSGQAKPYWHPTAFSTPGESRGHGGAMVRNVMEPNANTEPERVNRLIHGQGNSHVLHAQPTQPDPSVRTGGG